jgi:glutaredoxin
MPIKIYSRQGCAPCKTLKYWLGKKGLKYEEFEADDSTPVVPVTYVGDYPVVGLNLALIAELLKI